MMISLIVAKDKNNAIGLNNSLPWHLPEDLKHFKKLTLNHVVIMGKNTFLSLPNRPLKDRANIVISTTLTEKEAYPAMVVKSIKEAIDFCDSKNEKEIFVIGGGKLYNEAINISDKLYITEVDTEIENADVFFPEIDLNQWEEKENIIFPKDKNNKFNLTFKTCIRK